MMVPRPDLAVIGPIWFASCTPVSPMDVEHGRGHAREHDSQNLPMTISPRGQD